MRKKAVFLDRDGVINIEKEYLYKIEDFEFVDGVFSSLKYLQKKDFLLFVITNQSGIRRGYYSYYDFSILNSWMIDEFFKKGVKISQVEFCPHIPQDNCLCRKPKIQMIQNILENYDIDLEKSWLIGDKHSDILCAKNANIKNTIQVQSGHKFDKNKSLASYIVSSIKDIQNIIV